MPSDSNAITNSNSNAIPRTANLLACKQWWKVCFIYGDQEKYYRQIYGKAASQRLALSKQNDSKTSGDAINTTTTTASNSPDIIFPTELKQRKIKVPFDDRHFGCLETDQLKGNSKVTVLDDPFLFGSIDSGITVDSSSKSSGVSNGSGSGADVIECHRIQFSTPNVDLGDLQLSEDELKTLHLSRNRRGHIGMMNDDYFQQQLSSISPINHKTKKKFCSTSDEEKGVDHL